MTDMTDAALRLFPGSTVVATQDYADFRRDLFALYKEAWGHLPQAERLEHGMRNACRMYNNSRLHPWWETIINEIETAFERVSETQAESIRSP